MRTLVAVLLLAFGGCATPFNWQRAGLTADIILRLEAEDWGMPMGVWDWPTRAAQMSVPVDARAIALREVRCSGTGRIFDCSYIVDYGRNGIVEGSYRKRYVTVGQDRNGNWSNDWVVVT